MVSRAAQPQPPGAQGSSCPRQSGVSSPPPSPPPPLPCTSPPPRTSLGGSVCIDALVGNEELGDLRLTVNGSAPVWVVSSVMRVQVPYFADLYECGFAEAQSGHVNLSFEIAEREHLVDVLRCVHGGEIAIEVSSLGALYEVARYLRIDKLLCQLWQAANGLITTAADLYEARITCAALLSHLAAGIVMDPAYACALLDWALRHNATPAACRAAGSLPAWQALQLAPHIRDNDAVQRAICEAAAPELRLYPAGPDCGVFGPYAWIAALRKVARRPLQGVGALVAEVPGDIVLKLSSGRRMFIGDYNLPDHPQCTSVADAVVFDCDTLGCMFRCNELSVSDDALLAHLRELVNIVSDVPEDLSEVRELLRCVRYSQVSTRGLRAARSDLSDTMLCSLLLQRFGGYNDYCPEPLRCSPERMVMVLAGAVAAAAVRKCLATHLAGSKLTEPAPLQACHLIMDQPVGEIGRSEMLRWGIFGAKDALGVWWPISVICKSAEDPGCWKVKVYDNTGTDKIWQIAYPHNMRRRVRPAAEVAETPLSVSTLAQSSSTSDTGWERLPAPVIDSAGQHQRTAKPEYARLLARIRIMVGGPPFTEPLSF